MMTLNDAIKHANEVADDCACDACAEDHVQLAGWLNELKLLRTLISNSHGKWIIHDPKEVGTYNCHCSKCGVRFFFPRIEVDPYNYCPNCGADMRGDDE